MTLITWLDERNLWPLNRPAVFTQTHCVKGTQKVHLKDNFSNFIQIYRNSKILLKPATTFATKILITMKVMVSQSFRGSLAIAYIVNEILEILHNHF